MKKKTHGAGPIRHPQLISQAERRPTLETAAGEVSQLIEIELAAARERQAAAMSPLCQNVLSAATGQRRGRTKSSVIFACFGRASQVCARRRTCYSSQRVEQPGRLEPTETSGQNVTPRNQAGAHLMEIRISGPYRRLALAFSREALGEFRAPRPLASAPALGEKCNSGDNNAAELKVVANV